MAVVSKCFVSWFLGEEWLKRVGGGGRKNGKYVDIYLHIPEKITRPRTVILCALSAHTLPLITTLSHVVNCDSRSFNLAARSLATFSFAVSANGTLPFLGPIRGGGGPRAFEMDCWALGLARCKRETGDVEGRARMMEAGLT